MMYRKYGILAALMMMAVLLVPSVSFADEDIAPPQAIDANSDGITDGWVSFTGGPVQMIGSDGMGSTRADAARARGAGCKWYKKNLHQVYSRDFGLFTLIYWRVDLIEKWCGHWDRSRYTGVIKYVTVLTPYRTGTNWHADYVRHRTRRVPGRPDKRNTKVEAQFSGGLTIKGSGISKTDHIVFGLEIRADGVYRAWKA